MQDHLLRLYLERCAAEVIRDRRLDKDRLAEAMCHFSRVPGDARRTFDPSCSIRSVLSLTTALYEALLAASAAEAEICDEVLKDVVASLLTSCDAQMLFVTPNSNDPNQQACVDRVAPVR